MRSQTGCFTVLCIICCLLLSTRSSATHVFGGELLYTYISGNDYKITLTIYGDCGAPSGTTFNSLYSAKPKIFIYNNTMVTDTVRLQPESLGVEVSPVCPRQLSQTTCNGGHLVGVKRFIYSKVVTLSGPSANWRFIFPGDMGVESGAGRSNNISNIYDPGSSIMQLEATLNNTLAANSSPAYSTIPTPFYCININAEYNQGAIDADGDSLAFSLVPGISAVSATNPLLNPEVSYIAPYSAESPLDAGAFSFNALNGQMSFTPGNIQDGLVVNRVTEYRNGVIVGTSEREMTFIISNDCDGIPPSVDITGLSGGVIGEDKVINVCVGTPRLSFGYLFTNPDADSSLITYSSLPAGATLSVANNNTPAPGISFSWNTDTAHVGIYTFLLTIKNNHCPISNTQTIACTINVAPQPEVGATLISPTQCVHKAAMQYDLAGGFLPRSLIILQGTNIMGSYTSDYPALIDSLPAGDYKAVVSSNDLCLTEYNFSVPDGGVLPLASITTAFCLGDAQRPLYVQPAGNTATITWFDGNDILPGPPVPSTAAEGTYTWHVIEQYKVCTSAKVAMNAIVHPLPDAVITSIPDHICYGDTINLSASGGISYLWSSPDEMTIYNNNGQQYIRLINPMRITVAVTDEYNCTDTARIQYGNIQPCCDFFYPTAFTPNGDGLNDGFHVSTFGNMMNYRLAVYDRWGQLMFLTFDPKQKWDGRHNGALCEMGTYFYYFRAMCLTGRAEEHKGDVTLIR